MHLRPVMVHLCTKFQSRTLNIVQVIQLRSDLLNNKFKALIDWLIDWMIDWKWLQRWQSYQLINSSIIQHNATAHFCVFLNSNHDVKLVLHLPFQHFPCLHFWSCISRSHIFRPCTSLPSARQHPSYGDCLEVKMEYYQNCSVLGCVTMFTVSSTLMWTVLTGPADSVCHIGTLTPCIEAVA